MRVASFAASLLLLPLAACPDPEPTPAGVCVVSDARDDAALDAWLATPLKTCSLDAVFPHRAALVSTQRSTGDATGWDAGRVLEGADANGVRSFGDDGRSFAAFTDLVPLGGDITRAQAIDPADECVEADEVGFTARAELVDGTCTVWVGDEIVFAAPLHGSMKVALASWPAMVRGYPRTPVADQNLPRLADGYEYVTLPPMRPLDDFERDPKRVDLIAGWLGVMPSDAGRRLTFDLEVETELLRVPDVELPYLTSGDGIPTIATRDEAAALRALPLHALWYYSGPLARPTRTASIIEITADGLRYTGGQPRHTPRAAADAAACVRTLMERDLAAITSRRADSVPLYTSTAACARLTTDLAAAVAADDGAYTLLLDLLSDETRARYGRVTATGIAYTLTGGMAHHPLAQMIGAGLVSGAAPLTTRGPSVILDHAIASWTALQGSRIPVEVTRRLAAAVVARGEYNFDMQAFGRPALPALTDADADALAAEIAAAPDPLDKSFITGLARRIAEKPVVVAAP